MLRLINAAGTEECCFLIHRSPHFAAAANHMQNSVFHCIIKLNKLAFVCVCVQILPHHDTVVDTRAPRVNLHAPGHQAQRRGAQAPCQDPRTWDGSMNTLGRVAGLHQ